MSVIAPSGFVAHGLHAGIKEGGERDLALVATADGGAVPTAAVFTQNLVVAAPVTVSRSHLDASGGRAAAVVLNSGNANACTGTQGERDAEAMCAGVARDLGCAPVEVLVCSTGLIGPTLPIDRLQQAIPDLVAGRSGDARGATAAAEAIMTTDTRTKQAVARRGTVVVGGMAKGAAMLAPNMATMLAVLTTNATVDAATLQSALADGVEGSFNAVTIDGCTSTNDTVILMGGRDTGVTDAVALADAVAEVCFDLAMQMVGDAEGHTKVVRLRVTGAESPTAAQVAARRVAESQLVKCSWYGKDPYWGRVASELGTAGVALDPATLSISYGGVVVSRGCVEVDHDRASVAEHMAGEYLDIACDLGVGSDEAQILTNDLTHAYIDENMGTS